MPAYNMKEFTAKIPFPGFELKFIHGENITSAHWQIDEGSLLPEHSHPHEQFSFVLEGKLELVIDGKTHLMVPGKVVVIAGNVLHSGKALTDCKVLDVFSPVRKDFV
jgi:quercetin dioxygenase-like cupin family protein